MGRVLGVNWRDEQTQQYQRDREMSHGCQGPWRRRVYHCRVSRPVAGSHNQSFAVRESSDVAAGQADWYNPAGTLESAAVSSLISVRRRNARKACEKEVRCTPSQSFRRAFSFSIGDSLLLISGVTCLSAPLGEAWVCG